MILIRCYYLVSHIANHNIGLGSYNCKVYSQPLTHQIMIEDVFLQVTIDCECIFTSYY